MWKTVLAGTTALAIAGSSLVYAQQGSGDFQRVERWRPGAEDITAFGEARIAALHAGLKLTEVGKELAGGRERFARSRQAAIGATCRARQCGSSEGPDRTAQSACRGHGPACCCAQETRRRGCAALQEPG